MGTTRLAVILCTLGAWACGAVTGDGSDAAPGSNDGASGASDARPGAADARPGSIDGGVADFCDPSPCINGGSCIEATDSCDCSGTVFAGPICEAELAACAPDPMACVANAVQCQDAEGTAFCACWIGFSGDADVECCPESSSYEISATTIFDPASGLTWERDTEPGKYTWAGANQRCADLGFRLPTHSELLSIVDAAYTPTWEPCSFRAEGDTDLWTSTVVGSQSAFIVYFSFGGANSNDVQQNMHSALCVH